MRRPCRRVCARCRCTERTTGYWNVGIEYERLLFLSLGIGLFASFQTDALNPLISLHLRKKRRPVAPTPFLQLILLLFVAALRRVRREARILSRIRISLLSSHTHPRHHTLHVAHLIHHTR